jgi:hypothetical protein
MHATHRHRRHSIALAAALCAALGGCASSGTPTATGTATTATNGPGQWTSAQTAAAVNTLEGPPVGESEAQATCIVQFAATNVSWQQFQNYVSFLQEQNAIATPSVLSALSNHAATCAVASATPGPTAPSS